MSTTLAPTTARFSEAGGCASRAVALALNEQAND